MASLALPSALEPAYEISPSPNQPPSKKTLVFKVLVRGWPMTPDKRTRFSAISITVASVISATTSGVI